jgi:hypothetical protein
LDQVSPARRGGLPYSFRYFQEYDEPILLPVGFEPTRIGIDIHSARDPAHGFRQAFVWKAQGMSVETEAAGQGPDAGAGIGVSGAPFNNEPHPHGAHDVQTETE